MKNYWNHDRTTADGFSLINVLVTLLFFSFGLMSLAGMYARFTSIVTENQNIAQMAAWSTGFWGVIQSSPAITTTMTGAYTQNNIDTAPVALSTWLKTVTSSLPQAQIVIATGADAVSSTPCSNSSGCSSVTMTITWKPNGSSQYGNSTRSQMFTYQLGL